MNNMNQSSSTEPSYYAPPPAMVKGLYLPTEKLAKQLKQKKLLPQMATPPQPLDADTFHPVHLKRKSRKPKPPQEKKKEHSSVWGLALLIGGGALVALIATLTFNKEAREKVAEVVPFLKTKTEGLGEKPHIDPDKSKKKTKPPNIVEPPHSNSGDPNIDPNIGQPPNNPQHPNVGPEPVLPNPPQDNAGGNGTGNANGIGEDSNNNGVNGRQPFTGDRSSEWEDHLTDPRSTTGNPGSNGNSLSSDDLFSEFVEPALAEDWRVNREGSSHGSSFNPAWKEKEEREYRRPLNIAERLSADIVVAGNGADLLAPDLLPIQLTTLSSPKLTMLAQEIRHPIDREAGDEAWRFLMGDINPHTKMWRMLYIIGESTTWMSKFKKDTTKHWTTEELFRFQAKLLNAVNNPDRLHPGLEDELRNNQEWQQFFNERVQMMSETIIGQLTRNQYGEQGTARGLNSEENHLALFYAYYNHFHLLAAMKTYTPPPPRFWGFEFGIIEEAPRPEEIQSSMRSTLTEAKKQLGKLKGTPYDFNSTDSEFFSDFLKGYLYPTDADSAAKWGAELPASSGIDFLLQPPHFPSEQAYLSLEKARDSIRVFKELGFEAKQDLYNYLEHAETYYGKQIKDDVHQHRYYGYAGLAETYALRAQVFKLENRDQTTIDDMIKQAETMLEKAESKSRDAEKVHRRDRSYDYGYVMDSSESWRIKSLIDDARP